MQLRLENPRVFSDIIGIISELVSEVKIKVNKEGLSITAIDPANVAMVSFKLPASSFSQLEVEEENLGVSLDSFKAILKRCSFGSSLLMKTEENFLKIEIDDKVKREFTLALIDLDRKDKPIPSLEFSAKIDISSTELQEAIEDCTIVADSCSFESEPNKFSIFAKGTLNTARLSYSSDEVRIESPSKQKGKYSLEYLQKMIRATKITDTTVLNFSNDYPLRLDFRTPSLELSFILAPRVETDD
ncbi:MAG: proliferating cell nuclear antigen (pcna) [Nanoarchaeota archaeon]